MIRTVLILLGLLAVTGAPVLCVGGLLAHECPCESQESQECQHETECPGDPCSDLLVVVDHAGFKASDQNRNGSHSSSVSVVELFSLPAHVFKCPERKRAVPGLAYPQSDHPLRI